MGHLLKGHRALVTGGTRGIGAAIASRLYQEGAEVLITGRHPLGNHDPRFTYHAVDLSQSELVEAFGHQISRHGGIDILINNAGINKIEPFEDISLSDFEEIQQVNVTAPFLLIRVLLPGMRKKGWGRIVNITSIFGVISKELRASYSASKFALDGMTAALAAEVASQEILANCVAPGFIETDLTQSILGAQGIKEVSTQIPARRLGRPDEVAALVAWLAGPENTYVTGQTLVIDGGFSRV